MKEVKYILKALMIRIKLDVFVFRLKKLVYFMQMLTRNTSAGLLIPFEVRLSLT